MGIEIFDDKNQVTSTRISWGKIGDHIFGTLTGKRRIPDQYHPGEEVDLYEVKAEGGEFHEIDGKTKQVAEATTAVKAGETWAIFGRGQLGTNLQRLKIGQKFGAKYVENKPSKVGQDQKIVKVYTTGAMDTEWLEEQNEQLPPLETQK